MDAIYLDTTTRSLSTYAVSVTAIVGGGIVLRHAAELPGGMPKKAFLLLVDTRGYVAQSSAGFVEFHHRFANITQVVGLCGFKWAHSLRPVNPFYVAMVPHVDIIKIRTHQNSNPATAEAAVAGLKQCVTSRIGILLEG